MLITISSTRRAGPLFVSRRCAEAVRSSRSRCAGQPELYDARREPARGGTRSWVPRREAREREPVIPGTRRARRIPNGPLASSVPATSAGLFDLSMTIRCGSPSRTISASSSGSSP